MNATLPLSWLGPNPVPVIVTSVPTVPNVGDRLATVGTTVKLIPLLGVPPTITTTLPLAASVGTGTVIDSGFQFVGVAAAPLNATVLVP